MQVESPKTAQRQCTKQCRGCGRIAFVFCSFRCRNEDKTLRTMMEPIQLAPLHTLTAFFFLTNRRCAYEQRFFVETPHGKKSSNATYPSPPLFPNGCIQDPFHASSLATSKWMNHYWVWKRQIYCHSMKLVHRTFSNEVLAFPPFLFLPRGSSSPLKSERSRYDPPKNVFRMMSSLLFRMLILRDIATSAHNTNLIVFFI